MVNIEYLVIQIEFMEIPNLPHCLPYSLLTIHYSLCAPPILKLLLTVEPPTTVLIRSTNKNISLILKQIIGCTLNM
jgi:hypothetical protein